MANDGEIPFNFNKMRSIFTLIVHCSFSIVIDFAIT